jgi:uncharacterized protein YkwD
MMGGWKGLMSDRNRALRALAAAAFVSLPLAVVAQASASEGDLGPYFENLRVDPPRRAEQYTAVPRANPVRRAAVTTGPLDLPMLERTVFTHINLYRASRGMRPLEEHGGLAATARQHSGAMAAGAPMNHDGMRGRLMPFMGLFGARAGGEILAYNRGAADPARTAMTSWINSYRHKDVIEEDYRSMGVGVAQRADGAYYFTVLFLR